MSSSQLDYRFFRKVSDTEGPFHGSRVTFEAYKTVYARSTMVLFSRKTHTPLAALTLKADEDDIGCLAMLTARPAPLFKQSETAVVEPYFQGMLSMSGQSFTFTISNLSDEGMINFNVLHTPDYSVKTVDPGPAYGVNEVNELHRNQSYTIEADQRTNRRMVLAGKTETVASQQQQVKKKVTVAQSEETTADDKKKGLYFYLSVIADKACPSLVEKFSEGTVWKVVPGLVRRVRSVERFMTRPDNIFTSPLGADCAFYATTSRGVAASAIGAFHRSSPIREGACRSPPARKPRNGSSASSSQQSHRLGLSIRSSSNEGALRGEEESALARGSASNFLAENEQAELFASDFDTDHELASNQFHPNTASAFLAGDTSAAAPVDIWSTQAAELKHGRTVQVHSSDTGHDYAYEHPSEPTVLCLSIWDDMKFLPLPNIEEELSAQVQDWIKNEGKELVKALNAIYKTETCVIDLVSIPDTVICTCGHQCINHANVTKKLHKCPMCRSPITAFVQADGMLLS